MHVASVRERPHVHEEPQHHPYSARELVRRRSRRRCGSKLVFEQLYEDVPKGLDFTPYDDRLTKKIARFEVRDRDIIERLVDSMLDGSVGDTVEDNDDA